MKSWPHAVKSTTVYEIRVFCADSEWQRVRLSLKKQTTERKLITLDAWRARKLQSDGTLPRDRQVQIDNYINALKRGGQLGPNLEVVR